MTRKHVRATSAKSARRKGGGKQTVVTRVNYIAGTRKGRTGTYDVTTRRKKR